MEGTLERDNGEITSPSIWPHAHTGTGPVPTKLVQPKNSPVRVPSRAYTCPWQASHVSSATPAARSVLPSRPLPRTATSDGLPGPAVLGSGREPTHRQAQDSLSVPRAGHRPPRPVRLIPHPGGGTVMTVRTNS